MSKLAKLMSGDKQDAFDRYVEAFNNGVQRGIKIAGMGKVMYSTANPDIKDAIFVENATVVLWEDGTTTTYVGNTKDKKKCLAMAVTERYLGASADEALERVIRESGQSFNTDKRE